MGERNSGPHEVAGPVAHNAAVARLGLAPAMMEEICESCVHGVDTHFDDSSAPSAA